MKKPKKADTKSERGKGRPPFPYTKSLSDLICERIATHTCGLATLCKLYEDMPSVVTIRHWFLEHEDFFSRYARAKMRQADLLAEECLDISDISTHETFAVDRLRIDTRKWLAAKLLPKQYGDRSLLEQKSEENEQLKEELRSLRATLDGANRKSY